ncbi:MAG: hypothetical protein JWM31_498 [Solirubrobacterales bacterium]|nr:hypothetical protein [Solirubrobacterales bacterium]
MTPLASVHFPDGSGYVLAAYLVFFLLLLIYLGITAYRLLGLERRLGDLTRQLDEAEAKSALDGASAPAPAAAAVPAPDEVPR